MTEPQTAREWVDKLLAEGWEVVQEGRVLVPFEAKHPKPSFSERVEGFNFGKLRHGQGDKLFDSDEEMRWWHLRKP